MKAGPRPLPDMGDRVVLRKDPDQIVHEVGLTGDRSLVLVCNLDDLARSDTRSHVPYHFVSVTDRPLTCVECIAESLEV